MAGGNTIDPSLVKVSCNWTLISGCPLDKALIFANADPDVFQRPTNDDLVDQDRAVLLNKTSDDSEYCELDIQVYPEYKIQAFSIVCSVDKIEIFQGLAKEYFETIYGEILMDEDYMDDQLKTYRFDVELQKSGITRLTIKTAPNPRGITTLIPNSDENATSELTNVEKSKRLLELLAQSKTLKENTQQFENMNIAESDRSAISIQDYIDKRLSEVEERINQRLDLMEQRQMSVLNRLLEKLESM
ncbi:uncharacterized protein LOC133338111 [Musca vetustissima]|uniref:uncharacterized protein LOC133338111 n=1 Tax=Musca vetustissima TaxID=27455 RepID=UPI002AB6314A|nr:uncharacterized protein LOC133338111 [Musca vetustissima]